MRKKSAFRVIPALLLGTVSGLTACDAPETAHSPSDAEFSTVVAPALLECPSEESQATRGRLLATGGTVTLGNNAVAIPLGALLGSAEIEIEVPASRHLVVELRANGQEHWQFLAPLTVTIDYSRCRTGLLDPPVSVWHVDSQTGALLEHMGGIDNRLTRTVTFVTDHFSGYAIAN